MSDALVPSKKFEQNQQTILDVPGVTKHFARGLEYGSTHNDNIKLFLECAEFISRSK